MCGQEFGIKWDYICLLGPVKKEKTQHKHTLSKEKKEMEGRFQNIAFCIRTVKMA